MSHHETPQKRERQQKLKILHSPLTPPTSTPPIYLPLCQQAPKRKLGLRRRGRIWRQGRDSPRGSNEEARGVVIVSVVAESGLSWRRGTLRWRRWSWWSCSRLGTWSRSMSGLGTCNLWVGGDRCIDLLGDNMKVVILLTQTLNLWCSEARKRWRLPRTG
jgi:hypothetical protein